MLAAFGGGALEDPAAQPGIDCEGAADEAERCNAMCEIDADADFGREVCQMVFAVNVLGRRYGLGHVAPFAGNPIGMAMTRGLVAGKIVTGQEVL